MISANPFHGWSLHSLILQPSWYWGGNFNSNVNNSEKALASCNGSDALTSGKMDWSTVWAAQSELCCRSPGGRRLQITAVLIQGIMQISAKETVRFSSREAACFLAELQPGHFNYHKQLLEDLSLGGFGLSIYNLELVSCVDQGGNWGDMSDSLTVMQGFN